MEIYPLKFKPIFKERIWGGQQLKASFGKSLPANVMIGESWELVDLPEDKSEIVNGPLAGKTIDEVIDISPVEITGNRNYQGPFPLLIKILDASDVLSVQVHPDAETCKRTGKGDPKTECWYIIDAAQDAVIYKGLKKGTTKEQFTKSIDEGSCQEYLEKIHVSVGECHYLPSGLCHAIGPGLVIAEIQQPSDTTYRVFDWNRIGDDGKPRQLHIKDALESIRFTPFEEDLSTKTVGRLVDTDVFKIDKGHQIAGDEVLLASGIMKVIIFLNGSGTINSEKTLEVTFTKGDTLLIPAAYTGVMSFTKETEYLIATV